MNTKLRFQVGPEPLISPVRHGPCGLNPALLGEIPPWAAQPGVVGGGTMSLSFGTSGVQGVQGGVQ